MHNFISSPFFSSWPLPVRWWQDGVSVLVSAEANYDCYAALRHHCDTIETLTVNPGALVSAAEAHCVALAVSDEPFPESALSLRTYQLDPFFLWTPVEARKKVVAWARDIFVVQLAHKTPFLEDLPDDCAGDIMEFFVTRDNLLSILSYSPESNTWVRAVVVAGLVAAKMVSNAALLYQGHRCASF